MTLFYSYSPVRLQKVGRYQKSWCPGHTPGQLNQYLWEKDLSFGHFKFFPGNSNVTPRLGITLTFFFFFFNQSSWHKSSSHWWWHLTVSAIKKRERIWEIMAYSTVDSWVWHSVPSSSQTGSHYKLHLFDNYQHLSTGTQIWSLISQLEQERTGRKNQNKVSMSFCKFSEISVTITKRKKIAAIY